MVIRANPYVWKKLSAEGQKHQQHLHEQYGQLHDLVRVLLRKRVQQVHEQFEEANRTVSEFVTHEDANHEHVSTEIANVNAAADLLVSLVASGDDPSDHRPVMVR